MQKYYKRKIVNGHQQEIKVMDIQPIKNNENYDNF